MIYLQLTKNIAYGQILDTNANGHGHFSVTNGIATFQRAPVSYQYLQEQNYWLTNMVMQNSYLNYNS